MKQKLLKIAMFQMRMVVIAMVLLLPGLMIVSAKAEKFYMELWKELGITQQEGKARIREGFIYGFLYEGGFRNIANILKGNKREVAEELLEYTKTYVYGSDFKEDYLRYRETMKPALLMVSPTEAAIRKKYIDVVSAQMEQIKVDMEPIEGEIRKLYQDQYDLLKRQITDFNDPKSKTVEFIMQNEAKQFTSAINYYKEQLNEWERDFPVDALQFIKNRLCRFLDETSQVDYTAKLIKIDGRKHFEKAEYDLKPNAWKYAYQAGQDVTVTVRSYVEEWLVEMEKLRA